jgi:hypothetical protein
MMCSLEVKSFGDTGLNFVNPGMLHLFSSKNTGCLLADQWEDKYLYWEICRCDL